MSVFLYRVFSVVKESDLDELLDDDVWVTSDLVNKAQDLLKKQHPFVDGLNAVQIGKTGFGFDRLRGEGVQILHVRECHWITTSCLGGGLIVVDSVNENLDRATCVDLCHLYCSLAEEGRLIVELIPSQAQKGSTDCGLFAIANAVELASGMDAKVLEGVRFDQSNMRQHLRSCLLSGQMQPFPKASFWSSVEGKRGKLYDLLLDDLITIR